MRLRVLDSQWSPFAAALCSRDDVETAGVILAERIAADVLIARELALVLDDGYAIRQVDRIRIDPIAFNRLVRPARERGLSIFTVHTHPGTREPWFSNADDIGDGVLMPSLFAQTDGPHGSLVVAGETRIPVARAWQQGCRCCDAIVGSISVVAPGVSLRRHGASHRDEPA
jgi:hypothetical protein